MFSPSSSLLFRPVPALNKLKIHHPLPLTQRESTQLLNLLNTSFRNNLDTEHPSFRTTEQLSRSSKPNTKPRRRSLSEYDGHHTDRHMQSVLTNPLFTLPPKNNFSRHGRDPMEVFDLAVANGMMDLNHAKACLSAKKDRIIQSTTPSVRDGMRESGAGMKVLRWLISSGTANNNQFLKDQVFADLLMEYLVAEELQEQPWKWIKRSFEDLPRVVSLPFGETSKALRRQVAGPLRALVRAEAMHRVSFDAAYLCMSRAASYLKAAPSTKMTIALQPAGIILLTRTCMPQHYHPAPSESTFESFVSLIPVIVPKKSNHYLAHLSILHPTKPDPSLALDYLRKIESSNDDGQYWTHQPTDMKSYVIQLGLDTAKVLLEQNHHSDLEWTMNFLSKNFPEQLGIDQRKQLEQVKAEASSIELLASLGIA